MPEEIKKTETKKKTVTAKVVTSVKAQPKLDELVVEEKDSKKKAEYLYGVGKRKSAVAQVRVYKKGTGKVTINGKDVADYCATPNHVEKVLSPLKVVGQNEKLDVTAKVVGGGSNAQAEAVRHGMARALLLLNINFRKPLKKSGYITRDPRKKERKKPGLKRARKAPQWKKR